MFGRKSRSDDVAARLADFEAKFDAVSRSQAVIEFTPDGSIITANDNFLQAMGYSLAEIVGRHHATFVDSAESASSEYRDFWARLKRGEFVATKFRRFAKGAREVWIQASYNPVFDTQGRVIKVMKIATDITAEEQASQKAEAARKLAEAEQAQVVAALGGGLERLRAGELTCRLETAFPADYEKLRADFNAAATELHDTLVQITSSCSALRSGSEEISRAADDLSRRTEQQAATLEETAAALDEITATVRTTSEGATHARGVVADAKTAAEHSGRVVTDAVTAMGEIERSSGEISQIIGVIDEIAFQTNLLALNAGVEAARAGDAGRGFAVVASEVRALAQRSAEAAKEIKALISTSSSQVSKGVRLVSETGEALSRIAAQVADINGVMLDIAASAQEQATGLHQVNTAVNQIDQVVQQNAAMVEQSTAASHGLADESAALSQLVARFQLAGEAQPQPQSVRPAARAERPAVVARSYGGALRKPEPDAEGWEHF